MYKRQEQEYIVLDAEFTLPEGDPQASMDKMNELNARRRDKQPLNYPSAGSTFKRPAGHFAGALIEQCGLKGSVSYTHLSGPRYCSSSLMSSA